MHPWLHSRFRPISYVLACVLLLQTVGSAWASGIMAGGPILDIFGNPLCVTGSDMPGSLHNGGAPDKYPGGQNCCTFGCSVVAPFEPARDLHDALAMLWPPEKVDAPGHERPIRLQPPGHWPGNPRAPPLTT